jgi:hypothetical protein
MWVISLLDYGGIESLNLAIATKVSCKIETKHLIIQKIQN